jgi:hypothetical protein
MKFGGEGLNVPAPNATNGDYNLTFQVRPAGFELPSMLNIGASYDFYAGNPHRISVLGNFTANSFSVDQLGVGAEYSYKEMFMARLGYRYDLGISTSDPNTRFTRVSCRTDH